MGTRKSNSRSYSKHSCNGDSYNSMRWINILEAVISQNFLVYPANAGMNVSLINTTVVFLLVGILSPVFSSFTITPVAFDDWCGKTHIRVETNGASRRNAHGQSNQFFQKVRVHTADVRTDKEIEHVLLESVGDEGSFHTWRLKKDYLFCISDIRHRGSA